MPAWVDLELLAPSLVVLPGCFLQQRLADSLQVPVFPVDLGGLGFSLERLHLMFPVPEHPESLQVPH